MSREYGPYTVMRRSCRTHCEMRYGEVRTNYAAMKELAILKIWRSIKQDAGPVGARTNLEHRSTQLGEVSRYTPPNRGVLPLKKGAQGGLDRTD